MMSFSLEFKEANKNLIWVVLVGLALGFANFALGAWPTIGQSLVQHLITSLIIGYGLLVICYNESHWISIGTSEIKKYAVLLLLFMLLGVFASEIEILVKCYFFQQGDYKFFDSGGLLSYSGFRVLMTREIGFEWIDFLVMLLVGAVGIGFLMKMKSANIVWNAGIVYYLLCYLFLVIAFDMLRFLKPKLIKNKRFRIYDHIYKMTSAFTALISAGIGTVLSGWEPYSQIGPAMLGTVWLVFCLIYFPRKVSY